MEKKRILIAEDDKLLSTIFKMFLKDLEYELVGIVVDGKETLKAAKELKPDIILMDIHLKGEIDGIETAKIIQETLDIPVVFISHDTRDETIKAAIATKSYGFLAKPIDISSLGVSIELAYYKHKKNLKTSIKDQLYKTIIENSPDAIVVIMDDKIEYLNNSAIHLLNVNLDDDVIQYNIDKVFKKDASEIIREKIKEAENGNRKIVDIELVVPIDDDENVFLKAFGSIIEFEGQYIVHLVLREN